MTDDEYKKFTAQAKGWIKGEAFFEAVVADYCLPHHIVAPKDLGIDYICEWVYGAKPTGILFAVQVKAFSSESLTAPEYLRVGKRNRLKTYKISASTLESDDRTWSYWRALGIPVYVFVVVYPTFRAESDSFNVYYRRLTEVLTVSNLPEYLIEDQNVYYEVYAKGSFLAFADQTRKEGGFARDLFVDSMRCSYFKGSIAWINPRSMGLGEFSEEHAIFGALFDQYRENLEATYENTKRFIEGLDASLPSASEFPEGWPNP
jgi:hypothetical protein